MEDPFQHPQWYRIPLITIKSGGEGGLSSVAVAYLGVTCEAAEVMNARLPSSEASQIQLEGTSSLCWQTRNAILSHLGGFGVQGNHPAPQNSSTCDRKALLDTSEKSWGAWHSKIFKSTIAKLMDKEDRRATEANTEYMWWFWIAPVQKYRDNTNPVQKYSIQIQYRSIETTQPGTPPYADITVAASGILEKER